MCGIFQNKMSEYQLREAAGKYWLLHMTQKGNAYERPLQLNSMGATLWNLFLNGKTVRQSAEILSEEYQVPITELEEDVRMFCRQLEQCGILVEE